MFALKILIALSFVAVSSSAQINILDASTLSSDLKKNAHSVKREEKIEFEVKSIDNARLNVHQVFTVLDEAGTDDLFFAHYSDKFQELTDAEIKVFDARGSQINKYKKKEMISQAIGEGLVTDGRGYFFRVSAPSFPITVQIDYEMKYKATLNYPDFDIQDAGQGVEHSSYTAIVPVELDLRFKQQHTEITPLISNEGKNKIYRWEVKNINAFTKEEGTVKHESRNPKVLIAPNKFEMDGKPGDQTTWKNFGEWLSQLYNNLDILREERKVFFKEMVKNIADDKQKAKVIYNYLQKNFRYVSIQLGIGGFRPFSADFTDLKKYGDCKALANYMRAALNAVDINSNLAIINAEYNSEAVDPGFPSNQFNHVILCIPQKKDSIWLECTSTTSDFGVLGTFTENRNALLITENGGVLVSTPKSRAADNRFTSSTKIILDEDGSGKTTTLINTTGEYKEQINYVLKEKEDEKKDFLVNGLGYKNPDEFSMNEENGNDASNVFVKMSIEKIPDFKAGSKMFLSPRIYKLTNASLPEAEHRKMDYYFRNPYEKTDTTIYILPEGYSVEALPKPRNIKYEYGYFATNYVFNEKEKSVISSATLVLNQNKIPAEKFDATRKFYSKVIEEYTDKIVVKKAN